MLSEAVRSFNGIEFGCKKVGVSGDWHGDSAWAEHAIEKLHEAGVKVVLHLGDFGVWPGAAGRKYLFWVNKVLQRYNMFLFVTLGNHEDYRQIAKFDKVEGMEGCLTPANHPNIIIFSRGFNWTWNDNKFMSFGGANSIDRKTRKEDKSWWEGERITDKDVENGVKVGKVDVMVTHDAPIGVEIFGSHRTSGRLPLDIQLYADESRTQLKRVTDVAQPKVLMHGHYHMYRNEMDTLRINGEYSFYETNHICLDRDYTPDNLGIFHTDTMKFELISYV